MESVWAEWLSSNTMVFLLGVILSLLPPPWGHIAMSGDTLYSLGVVESGG